MCESVLKCGKCKVRGGAFLFPWHSNFSRAIKKVWGLENARTKKNPTYNYSESSKNWKIVQWIIIHVWEVLHESTAKIGGFFGNLKGKNSANFQNRNFLDFSSLCNMELSKCKPKINPFFTAPLSSIITFVEVKSQ